MKFPAIIVGDPNSVLRLPKAAMRNSGVWQQSDSDILAHLIQVYTQIQISEWYSSDFSLAYDSDFTDMECSLPSFEAFVYVSVYFRQFIASKDALLDDAVNRYCNFADCRSRIAWVKSELHIFNSILDGDGLMTRGYTIRELFEAFIYGAGLLHKISASNDTKKKRFHDIYDKQPRHFVLFALNASLKSLMNQIGNITVVIHRDYSHWLHDYGLPRPDVPWHEKLFNVDAAEG